MERTMRCKNTATGNASKAKPKYLSSGGRLADCTIACRNLNNAKYMRNEPKPLEKLNGKETYLKQLNLTISETCSSLRYLVKLEPLMEFPYRSYNSERVVSSMLQTLLYDSLQAERNLYARKLFLEEKEVHTKNAMLEPTTGEQFNNFDFKNCAFHHESMVETSQKLKDNSSLLNASIKVVVPYPSKESKILLPHTESHPLMTCDVRGPQRSTPNAFGKIGSPSPKNLYSDLITVMLNQESRLALGRSLSIPSRLMEPTTVGRFDTLLRSRFIEGINPASHFPCTDLTGMQQLNRMRDVRASNTRFPAKLHCLLLDLQNLPEGITTARFLPGGMAFIIIDLKRFEGEVMKEYFPRMKHFASFQRQLNLYNFRRISLGAFHGAYYHEKFIREFPILSNDIKRS
jgi:HSF-type DNA-binding